MLGFGALGEFALGEGPIGAPPGGRQSIPPLVQRIRTGAFDKSVGLNPNLFKNAVPNNQYDWSKPQRVARAPFDLSVALNPNIFLAPAALPFNQVDWAKPARLKGAFDYSVPLNPNLFTNQFPNNQYDWSKPVRVPQARLDPPYPLNINLFTNAYPFDQYDWNKSFRSPPARFVPTVPLNINIFTNQFPFAQYDWSKPFRLPRAPFDLSVPINISLSPPVIVVPFNQFSYPPAIRIRPPPLTPFPLLLPIVVPPGTTASKIIALDAAYGSSDVTRFFRTAVPSQVTVGDNVAVLIDVGTVLNPAIPLRMFFTRPDGSVFNVSAYIGRPLGYTGKGIFEESTYAVCVLTGQQVSQHGIWTCHLREGIFESNAQQFYIGPPTVLV